MSRSQTGSHVTGARAGEDNPPPIPPRASSLRESTHNYGSYRGHLDGYSFDSSTQSHHSTSHSFHGHHTGYQASGRPNSLNTSQSMKMNPNSININQSPQRQSVQLISLSPPEEKDTVWPAPVDGTAYCMDLEGIDFSAPPKEAGDIKASASAEDVTQAPTANLYPDIRSAFSELQNNQFQPTPQYTDWTSGNLKPRSQRNSMPITYGWDPNMLGHGAGLNQGTSSVPTTPLQGQFFPNPQPHQYGGVNLQTHMHVPYPPQTNFFPNQFPSSSNTPSAINKPSTCDTTSSTSPFNLVPNLDFVPPPSAGEAWAADNNRDSTLEPDSQSRQNNDLIQLGFEGILTSDEKEYFSLEYFDPLHKKGRTTSVSITPNSPKDIYVNYSFAKPPEDETDRVNTEKNAWVTFEDDVSVFGEIGDKFGADDQSLPKPPAPHGVIAEKADSLQGHERLRKKLFVDEESDAFCQMVAELKREYESTDETTNLGFIVSPMCDKQQETISVKIIVHSVYSEEPFTFTSDVNSLVEHVIEHILYSCLSSDVELPRHMTDALKAEDFILKVYDKSEYLLNNYPLSKYSYTHDCLKMGFDPSFSIMRRQDVALPFLRTIDDDVQHLYFPQDHIKDTDVNRDSLEILMETFYKEVEKVTDLVLKNEIEKVQFQSLSQSVKAICNILSKIETIDVAKSLQRVESILNQLKDSTSSSSQISTLPPEHSGGGYATLQRHSPKPDTRGSDARLSLIPNLEEGLETLVNSVKQLVRIYCQAFHTDFHLGTKIDQPWDPQDVLSYSESFIVQICSVHRIKDDWGNIYEEYKIECSLYHGKKRLNSDVTTTCATICTSGLVHRIIWDEWLTFDDISLCQLPRETRLCITLVGQRSITVTKNGVTESQKIAVPLGGVTIQLFNKRGYMSQGSQLVPFQMKAAADPVTPFCSTLQPDSALLQFNLPDFGKQILFSEPCRIPEVQKLKLTDLAPEIREQVQEVMRKDCVTSCSADQLEILWLYRHYLHDYPGLLPWILQAAHGWDWACLPEIYCLLKEWSSLKPMQALELLLPQYPDVKVRGFAVDCLRKMPTDALIDFIPQLIQALKYESYHSSPLARLLLEQSCKSVRFAHQFFWLLKGATQDSLYKRRYELMFVALVSVAGESLYQEFMKQEEIVKVLTTTAEQVQQAKDKDNILRRNLDLLCEKFREKHSVLLPHNPGYEVSGLEVNSCSYYMSNAVPLKLVFRNVNEKAGPVYAMFKAGDDLRQDMMTMQIIRIMDRLWLKEGLDLKMITFSCLPTGPKRGFIELITESETLRKIQVSSGLTGSFKDRPIKDWLQKHNPTELEYQKAVENFACSCAGYCVATYVLGVCDRHNDNIMLKQSGHMFHIDFNKFLGDAQMFGNIKRDRVKFVLTSDMAYVINDGDRQSDKFQHFVDISCQAFNILRKHANLFINLFSLMLRSGIPGITEKGIEFIQKALLPGYTQTQASAEYTRLIMESLSAKSTQINFFIHNLAQMKFSSHAEGALLTFVPKIYNQQVDGKIKHVSVYGFQKRYSPEKHYIYTIKVERELQKVPSYIFRLFSEFVEFRTKLVQMFPQYNWPSLQGRSADYKTASNKMRVILGRSHIKAVAENRKTEIEKFLHELFITSPEISHSDLVYTFFHPLLRDEQEAQKERLALPKLRENPVVQRPKGEGMVKLTLEYVKDTFHIMVIHVKDLAVTGSELPSPYVKTYLLPDPEKLSKRKTKVIKQSTHPTYNELIEYKLSQDALARKTLQVTIWDHDLLGENNLLGAVYIKLCDLDLTNPVTNWFKLDKLQITDTSMLS